MVTQRVVITGMGAVSPFGAGVECLWGNLTAGRSAVKYIESMKMLGGVRSHVAGIVPDLDTSIIPRKQRRFMSPMSLYSTLAAFEAIEAAKLSENDIGKRTTGICIASTMGSSTESQDFFQNLNRTNSIETVKSTMFFKTMNHSAAANTALAIGITGRILSPSAACASGTVAIGMAYEAISAGHQEIMICGGTDEHHVLATGVFDIMNAASCRFNSTPDKTPRPFDRDRDGVVCAEGAGVLVLEKLEHAQQRGAHIFGEIAGFSLFSSPGEIAHPDQKTMIDCINCALQNARIDANRVDYVNAHATATIQGDIAESQAISTTLGNRVPVSSLKGYMGHTMAASGSLDLICSLKMMQNGILLPTRNLEIPDPECQCIDLLREIRSVPVNTIVKNSFALGGINSTLVVRRFG